MTTVYIKSDNDKDLNERGIAFIQKCGSTMSTACYKMDVVPRICTVLLILHLILLIV
jgi:hypothetical protein